MNKRTRTTTIIIVALVLALLAAPVALAAAGGGSAGFGGGGGGGEGGGGGGGFGLFIIIQLLIRIAFLGHGVGALVLLGLAIIWFVFTRLAPTAQGSWANRGNAGRRSHRRVAQRERRVELAAAEAAEEDQSFAPEHVRAAAAGLFIDIQSAWDANDRVKLRRLVAPELLAEWERRLDDFDRRGWRNRVKPLGEPKVEYVGLTHRGDVTDHVVVRIEAKLEDYVTDRFGRRLKRQGHLSATTSVREFWTLTKRGHGWVLASIEQGGEGAHALEEEIVATPWSDERGLKDEALVEGAVAEAVPATADIAELASIDFDGDAHAAAMDLSLADGRFAPDLLEIAARRATQAWATAIDGNDAELRKIADPPAIRDLLHPGDPSARTRLVLRGPIVNRIRIHALDASSKPPTMAIEVDLTGRRYIEDRDTTAVLAGSRTRSVSFTERWTLALDGTDEQPWRIVSVDTPVGLA